MRHTVTMSLDRVTKGAVRYQEPTTSPNYLIGTLYLRKTGLLHQLQQLPTLGEWPQTIAVTVEVDDSRHGLASE